MAKEEFENLAIGEEFTLGSKKLKVCKDCCKLQDYGILPQCANCFREDKTDVYFEEIKE